ncbi:ATP-binding protein [Solirubrobacter phytolaccae]|uniref:histidine kinase n=1 Tax=Solirubrobacter phytolaccae TaxID=1404360 RepID=A0A9X3N7C7_9ACTN|nr:ATP-binding protein [Solirubrobacter phytolaccae]MDA0179805.1 ATP-binding protein [Solirubrobacter phytolaccae]
MIEPAVLSGLAAVSRVSRALVAPSELPVLAAAALREMREALALDRAVLYLPDADGLPVLRRLVGDEAAPELSFDDEAWRLATGAPIVLREPAGWLVANPFDPPATDWVILPLVEGVVIASSPAPIALDPLSSTVLSLLCSQLSAGITTARLRRELQAAAIERERRTLAAEVHDGLAQYLAVAQRELALPEPDRARLTEAVASAHRLVRERLRTLADDTPTSLRAALESAARRARTPVHLSGTGDAGAEAITLAARVVSEALANADAHARAQRAEIVYTADDDALELTVRDDGCGFDPAHVLGVGDGHLGLTVMRERARGYGGECTVTSTPGTGTEVQLWLPL